MPWLSIQILPVLENLAKNLICSSLYILIGNWFKLLIFVVGLTQHHNTNATNDRPLNVTFVSLSQNQSKDRHMLMLLIILFSTMIVNFDKLVTVQVPHLFT